METKKETKMAINGRLRRRGLSAVRVLTAAVEAVEQLTPDEAGEAYFYSLELSKLTDALKKAARQRLQPEVEDAPPDEKGIRRREFELFKVTLSPARTRRSMDRKKAEEFLAHLLESGRIGKAEYEACFKESEAPPTVSIYPSVRLKALVEAAKEDGRKMLEE